MKYNRQIKKKKNECARISADMYTQGREQSKKITLLEDEVTRLQRKDVLVQGDIESIVAKAVRKAERSERQHCSSKNKKITSKLTSKLAAAKKETNVSKRCPFLFP